MPQSPLVGKPIAKRRLSSAEASVEQSKKAKTETVDGGPSLSKESALHSESKGAIRVTDLEEGKVKRLDEDGEEEGATGSDENEDGDDSGSDEEPSADAKNFDTFAGPGPHTFFLFGDIEGATLPEVLNDRSGLPFVWRKDASMDSWSCIAKYPEWRREDVVEKHTKRLFHYRLRVDEEEWKGAGGQALAKSWEDQMHDVDVKGKTKTYKHWWEIDIHVEKPTGDGPSLKME